VKPSVFHPAMAVCLLASIVLPRAAHGDVFVLAQGGQVVGELQNPEQSPRETYVVKDADGVVVTLSKAQVKQWIRPKPEEVEYEKIRATCPDTPDGQWELAEWCKERKLTAQRKVHLQRVVELDPDNEQAHKALGHVKKDGEWTTTHDYMIKQGYVWVPGHGWKTKQEAELLAEKREFNKEEKQWIQKIDHWIATLGTDRAEEARAVIVAIKDPAATKGLSGGLRNSKDPQVRAVLAEALANLGTNEAFGHLAVSAVDDLIEEVRLTCLDFLKKTKSPGVVQYFVGRLNDKDNGVVNRAGMALGAMGDRSAVGPLIDHLYTVHKFPIPGGGNPGQTSATFGTGPKGASAPAGLSVGGGPKFVKQALKNQGVLDALIALTGHAELGFDVNAWRTWFAAQKRREAADVRRDK
jgi:hypothetical protein